MDPRIAAFTAWVRDVALIVAAVVFVIDTL